MDNVAVIPSENKSPENQTRCKRGSNPFILCYSPSYGYFSNEQVHLCDHVFSGKNSRETQETQWIINEIKLGWSSGLFKSSSEVVP